MKVISANGFTSSVDAMPLIVMAHRERFSISVSGTTDVRLVAVVPDALVAEFMGLLGDLPRREFDVVAA